ncbi:cytochrome C assembly family protein [Sorangium sp. So ce124]|uniref:cytochrome C assembly family protein n=1 Tax=Sorangium sp. So ce124 TaxID=3133280 RepID=UPI003F625F15
MPEVISGISFALALLFYSAASALFFLDVARSRARLPSAGDLAGLFGAGGRVHEPGARPSAALAAPTSRHAPLLLGLGALGHATYVTLASFVARVCPVHSVHFMLSVASLLAIGVYLVARRRFRVDALGLLIGPLGLAFLLGTFFLGKPHPEPKFSPLFIAAHIMANLLGIALFLLAGASAALYLVQEKRLKQKRHVERMGNLPPLDTLDRAVHIFLSAGFPLLTLGIVTGTYWAHRLEMGNTEEVMRAIFGYATWLLIALVLLLRAAAGWRGRRAAYGTIAGLACAGAVLVIYLVRPAAGLGG